MLCARPRLAPHAPAPPCAVPKALTTVGRAPFAGRASSRWPRSSPRRRGRLARRCEAAGPGRRGLPLSRCRERECCSPCTPLPLAVQVDAEEWAQVPEDQPIADISLVDTVRAASTPTPTRRLPCTGHVLATTPASPPCAQSDENKLVWMKCLPMPIKRVASRLLDLGRLTWDDLLEVRPACASGAGALHPLLTLHPTPRSGRTTLLGDRLHRAARVDRARPLAPDRLQLPAGA